MTVNSIPRQPTDRFAGAMLAAACVLSVVVMAHHPTSAGSASLANHVHGALMIALLIAFAGFSRFSARLGLRRFPVLAGLVFYGSASVGNLLAATVNGFAVPALAAREPAISQEVFRFAWELNQALAYAAVYATSLAYVLWGAELFARKQRLAGIAGLAAGAVPAALLAAGALDMHVAGAFVVYAAQAAFGIVIGLLMVVSAGLDQQPSAHH